MLSFRRCFLSGRAEKVISLVGIAIKDFLDRRLRLNCRLFLCSRNILYERDAFLESRVGFRRHVNRFRLSFQLAEKVILPIFIHGIFPKDTIGLIYLSISNPVGCNILLFVSFRNAIANVISLWNIRALLTSIFCVLHGREGTCPPNDVFPFERVLR